MFSGGVFVNENGLSYGSGMTLEFFVICRCEMREGVIVARWFGGGFGVCEVFSGGKVRRRKGLL